MTELEHDHDEHQWVGRVLAEDDPGPMPDGVSRRIEAVLLRGVPSAAPPAWPAVAPPRATGSTTSAAHAGTGEARHEEPAPRVASLSGSRRAGRDEAAEDRRRLLLYRLLPAAAAVVLVGGAVVVGLSQLGGSDVADTAGTLEEADGGDEAAPAEALAEPGQPVAPPPNGLVATGTAYTAATLPDDVRALVDAVSDGSAAALEDEAAAESLAEGAPAPGPAAVEDSPLSSAAAFQACAEGLGAPGEQLPLAVDLATYEGTEAAIVVLADPAGGFEVVVTDRDCTPGSQRTAVLVPPA